jgi:hypothetical protein
MKILIKVTKEVLEQTSKCGLHHSGTCAIDANNCAIAVALQDLFGYVSVAGPWFHIQLDNGICSKQINLPEVAQRFVADFDVLGRDGLFKDRAKMKPISFEVDIPNEVIDHVGIGEAYRILSESKTLELVHP